MLSESIQNYLNYFLSEKLQQELYSLEFHSIGGGCINETYKVDINRGTAFFLKLNSPTKYPGLFAKEAAGLWVLGKKKNIRVPSVIACEEVDNYQVLLLEWVEPGSRTEQFWKKFGDQLAMLHKSTHSRFGLEEDNYIGSLAQKNEQRENWADFFIDCRLFPQIKLAKDSHLLQTKHMVAFEKLYKKLPEIFDDEKPALLHGDLWSGNFMCNHRSDPVLIDPAVYFGHRNMDLAMTTLFGGFDKLFYDSYNYQFPLASNYYEQWDICNLYPLLIHLNLFGLSYLGQIESMLRKFR